ALFAATPTQLANREARCRPTYLDPSALGNDFPRPFAFDKGPSLRHDSPACCREYPPDSELNGISVICHLRHQIKINQFASRWFEAAKAFRCIGPECHAQPPNFQRIDMRPVRKQTELRGRVPLASWP